jgi:hypothetical protein
MWSAALKALSLSRTSLNQGFLRDKSMTESESDTPAFQFE